MRPPHVLPRAAPLRRSLLLALVGVGLWTGCGSAPGSVPTLPGTPAPSPAPSLPAPTLTATPTQVSVPRGGSAAVTLNASAPLLYRVEAPAGLRGEVQGERLTVFNDAAADGVHTVTVTGTPASGPQLTVRITVNASGAPLPTPAPTPVLSLAADPVSFGLARGGSQAVRLSSNLPVSVQATLPPGLSATRSGDVLTVRNDAAPDGVHPVTVTATAADGQTRSVTLSVTATGAPAPTPPPAPVLSLGASPMSFTLTRGAAQTVNLSSNLPATFAVTLPPGLSGSVSGTVLTVRNDAAPDGAHPVTVTATAADGQTRSVTLSVTATGAPPPPFTFGASPVSFALPRGGSQAVTLTTSGPASFEVTYPDGLSAALSPGRLTVRNDALPDGVHTVTVRAVGANGQSQTVNLTVTASGAPPPPAPAPTPPPPGGSAFTQEVLQRTNAARAQARSCGGQSFAAAPALTANAALDAAAQGHAHDMATNRFFSHTGSDGSSVGDRIARQGYSARTWGENIAAGQRTPAEVVQAWLDSPGHCANLMNPAYRELGVGYLELAGSPYGRYWVQNFAAPR